MGFEELSGELHKHAEAEARKLAKAAERSSERKLEDAKAKADEIVKMAKKEASEFARQEASERITSAKLAAKKMLDEARDEAVERSLAEVWQSYKRESLKKATYPSLLASLVEEGKRELGDAEPVLYVRDEDKALVGGFATRKLPSEYSGGAILESQDGRVSVNKTLEERFSQKKLQLRKEAFDRMF